MRRYIPRAFGFDMPCRQSDRSLIRSEAAEGRRARHVREELKMRYIPGGQLRRTIWLLLIAVTGLAYTPQSANAVPSFARQTGQPCATCHSGFPQLTPFGQRFKLSGYTIGGGASFLDDSNTPESYIPPLSAMVIPTFTRTSVRQDSPPTNVNGWPVGHTNDNLEMQQASLFYGGTIYGNLGAFIQGTFDRAQQRTFLDNTDIRLAETFRILDYDAIIGLDLNNGPTVQDVWNTTPAWGFPFISATLAPQFTPPGTQIEGAWAGRVAGTTAYTFINDMLYLEAGGYNNLSRGGLNALGQACANNADYVAGTQQWYANLASFYPPNTFFPSLCSSNSLSGVAPYWRVALQPTWGEHSLMMGAFGFYPRVIPGRVNGYGVDSYSDLGFDAQYQWLSDPHAITLRLSYIMERQALNATYAQGQMNGLGILPFGTGNGGSTNVTNYLTSFKASASYVWNNMIGATVGYFRVSGTNDDILYGNMWTNPVLGGSRYGSPTGKGMNFDVYFMPWSNGAPGPWPWVNMKVGLTYTHYFQLSGGTNNFDGQWPYFNGTIWRAHNASDNNTLLLYSWTAF